jgi:hypothetical protein
MRLAMKRYYMSRAVLSIAFGGLVYLVSGYPLAGLLGAVLAFLTFVYLPRSGRYRVDPQKGATALYRDEWTQGISQRSGRNAWVVVTIVGSGLVLYYGLLSPRDVPVSLLGAVLMIGWLTYVASDYWMRKL